MLPIVRSVLFFFFGKHQVRQQNGRVSRQCWQDMTNWIQNKIGIDKSTNVRRTKESLRFNAAARMEDVLWLDVCCKGCEPWVFGVEEWNEAGNGLECTDMEILQKKYTLRTHSHKKSQPA